MEENNKKRQLQRAVFVFTLVVCLSAIAGGQCPERVSGNTERIAGGFVCIDYFSTGRIQRYRHCGCFPGVGDGWSDGDGGI